MANFSQQNPLLITQSNLFVINWNPIYLINILNEFVGSFQKYLNICFKHVLINIGIHNLYVMLQVNIFFVSWYYYVRAKLHIIWRYQTDSCILDTKLDIEI